MNSARKVFRKQTIRMFFTALCALLCVFQESCIHYEQPLPIVSGQPVEVTFGCKLESGELISATDDAIVRKLEADPLSSFIGPAGSDGRIIVLAGEHPLPKNPNPADKLRDFQAVLKNEIGRRIVGMSPGEARHMTISAEDTPEISSEERFLRMANRYVRLKKKTLPLSLFKKEEGDAPPEIGKDMTRSAEPWLRGVVTAITESAVIITYSATTGETVMTPYGSAVISENEKEYIIDLTPVVGRVIRAGGFLGRIVDADGKMFTLDFGNPFGGEKIFCDVTALGIAERGKDDAADHLKVQPVSENLSGSSQITAPVSEKGALASESFAGTPAEVSTDGAAIGDLLVFDFSLRNGDGELVMTSRQAEDADTAVKKSDSYEQPEVFAPAELILGKREIVPFIEKALYGMKSGEMKDVHIAPEDAYGKKDPAKVKTFPLVKALPEEIRITREEFKNRFKFDPEAGKQIQVVPIFMSEVASVEGDQVVIKHIVDDGKNIPGELGFTEILRRDGKIIMTLSPIVGATIDVKGERGVITGSNKTGFDVDFNPAHAGESFSLDLAVHSLVKQAQFRKEIPWKAELNEVLESSDQRHKPAVLVLYAEWCGWSKKLLTETLTDPRITSQADNFLWCKIDTDQEKDIYALYEQTSYPMVVLLKENGDVLKKLDGFVNAVTLSRELKGLL